MKKTITKIVIALSLCLILVAAFFVNNPKEYEIKEKYSFTENFDTSFLLTAEEKDNITKKLQNDVIMTDEYFGFKADYVSTDLYFANSLVEISKTLNNNTTLTALNGKMSELAQVDLHSLSILNLIYYINICKCFNITYNENDVVDCLQKFYDSEEKLFFLNGADDTVNIKIVVTALCCKTIPGISTLKEFNIITGIQKVYENYEFSTDKTITFYNSGGDILYCYSIIGLIDDSLLSKHKNWFEFWKNQYENMTINSIETALAYSEYCNIADIFDNNHSNEKIQIFYHKLTKDALPDETDFYMLSNAIQNIDRYDNTEFNSYIKNKVNTIIASEPLFAKEKDIDVLTTFYGIILSKNVGFEIDKQKMQNYINKNYSKINDMDGISDIINNLYYTIMLDQLNNDYKISCSVKNIQKIIDKSIKSLAFDKNVSENIFIARKTLEIVMDLQVFNFDININERQRDKIEKGIKKAINNNDIMNSLLITDLFILDTILDTGLVNDELFYNVYNTLTIDGGSKVSQGDQYTPDINSTYRFFVCFGLLNNYNFLPDQKKYVESVQVIDGIYSYNAKDKSHIDFESILHGNSMMKLVMGGTKSD